MRKSSLLLASLAFAGSAFAAAEPTVEQAQFFESKIRPILADKCYKCHSVEGNKSKGGLTLDTREGLLKGGESGPGLKPGDAERSLLIKAVLYTDKDLQMPPKGEKLSATEIADLTSWVKMGAPDPRKAKGGKLSGLTDKAKQHWAFQPVVKSEIPLVKNRAWCYTPIDAFVMQKLEEQKMSATPGLLEAEGNRLMAGKAKLLRRATYDLTGLPPTPEELKAFENDQTQNAFANVIDRLLASPHYGERWGRYWLDTARYSDTTGLRDNQGRADYRFPYAWTYRDWVIKSFNDDLPYDQFITQQLAADKIPGNPKENLAALGFLTVGERFPSKNDVINDRIDTVSKGFVGLTVACARCHDHMFDPIPTKDYYALHGIFASTNEPEELPVLSAAIDPSKKADYDKKVVAAEAFNRAEYYKLIGNESAKVRMKMGSYLQAAVLRKDGMNEANQTKAQAVIDAEKLDVPLLNELRGMVRPNNELFGPFVRFAEGGLASAKATATAIAADKKINPLVAAAFQGAEPKSIEDVAGIYTKLFNSLDDKAKDLLGKYASSQSLSDTFDKNLTAAAFAPFRILPAVKLDSDLIRDETQRLNNQVRGRAKFDFAKLNELLLTSKGADVRAMAVEDAKSPHDSPVFIRGQAGVTGDMVPRRFLEMFSNGKPQPFTNGSGRLELAQAIASKTNPMTARVMVNRVWMHHFGQGFVRTPDDLGTQSEAPSHPELINYLAALFMEHGWSLKTLHKLIMLSHVYQEDSLPAPSTMAEYIAKDPENRLLWRANVRRLDFEAFRDSLLVMSGRLDRGLKADEKSASLFGGRHASLIGGQPVNLTDEPYSYRRSIYGYIDRGNVAELMTNFDFSRPDMPNSARTSTIVPQQALFLMNSPMIIDMARQILQQPNFRTAGVDFMRVTEIYRSVLQRNPDNSPAKNETANAIKFINGEISKQPEVNLAMKDYSKKAQDRAEKRTDDLANRSFATKAIQNEGDIIDRRPLNPWETFAQALLFSNEASYVN